MNEKEPCKHLKCIPKYDKEDVIKNCLTAEEICKKYPRFHGVCPDCGEMVIVYNCVDQYISGDW